MGRLAPGTVNCYRSRLKKLRRVLPAIPEDHEERPKVLREIEKLTNQLGMEMTDLELALTRGPGRPRSNAQIEDFLPKAPEVELKVAETPEERDARFAKQQEERRQRIFGQAVQETTPEDVKRSEDDLKALMELANETLVKEEPDETDKATRKT